MGAVPPVAPALGIKSQRRLARRALSGIGRDIKIGVEKTGGVAALARANCQIMAQRLHALVPRIGILHKVPCRIEKRTRRAAFLASRRHEMEKRVEARAPHVRIVFQIPCPVEQGRRDKAARQPVSHEMSERRQTAGAAGNFSIERGCKIGGRLDALKRSVIYVIDERILIAPPRSAGVLIPSWIE